MNDLPSFSALIVGRTVIGTAQEDGQIKLSLEDGSLLTVQTAPASSASPSAASGTIQSVQQRGASLQLEYENGWSQQIACATESGCVTLTDREGQVLYSG